MGVDEVLLQPAALIGVSSKLPSETQKKTNDFSDKSQPSNNNIMDFYSWQKSFCDGNN